jgi:hypothetical protein
MTIAVDVPLEVFGLSEGIVSDPEVGFSGAFGIGDVGAVLSGPDGLVTWQPSGVAPDAVGTTQPPRAPK